MNGCGLIYQLECDWVVSSNIFFFNIVQRTTCKLKGKMLGRLFFIPFEFFRTFFDVFLFSFHLLDDAPFRVIGSLFPGSNGHCNKNVRWFNGKWRQRTAISQHQQSKTTFAIKLIDFCLNQWLWKHSKMNVNYERPIRITHDTISDSEGCYNNWHALFSNFP